MKNYSARMITDEELDPKSDEYWDINEHNSWMDGITDILEGIDYACVYNVSDVYPFPRGWVIENQTAIDNPRCLFFIHESGTSLTVNAVTGAVVAGFEAGSNPVTPIEKHV